jgi:hypothetical protein
VTEDPNAQATGAQTTGQSTGEGAQAPRTYTDADIAAARRRAEKRAEDAETALAKMQEATKTADEKARDELIRTTTEGVESKLKTEFLQKEIRAEIRVKLAEAGVPANQAAVLLAEGNIEALDDVETAVDKYAVEWKKLVPGTLPKVPGQAGAPTIAPTSERPWSNRKINEFVARKGHAALAAHYGEIGEDRRNGTFVND